MAHDPLLGSSNALPHVFRGLNGEGDTRKTCHLSFLGGTDPVTAETALKPYIIVCYGDVRAAWDRRTVQKMGYADTRRAAFGVFVCGTQCLTWAHHGHTHFQRIRLFARFKDSDDWLLIHDIGFKSLVDKIAAIRVDYDEGSPLGDVGNSRINGWRIDGDNDTNDRDMMKFCLVLMGGFMVFTLAIAAISGKDK